MKSIIESIIGRKSASRVLQSFDDLRYGDVVEIYNKENIDMYIYMPMKQLKDIENSDSLFMDGFVRYNPNYRKHFSYWDAYKFEQRFPKHSYWDNAKITRYIAHINEWQSISDGNDIKKLFSKYNIPINEAHINESIIGRKSASKVLRSLDDLRYGDVVEITDELNEITKAYIYIPTKLIISNNFDGFVTYDGIIKFWRSNEFRWKFPNHEDWGTLVKITKYITHINEWQSISDIDDIKKLFSKYHIPA